MIRLVRELAYCIRNRFLSNAHELLALCAEMTGLDPDG